MYPVTPTTLRAGVSMMVTGSTTSFLLIAEPGFSASRTTCVIPALKPINAVRWMGYARGLKLSEYDIDQLHRKNVNLSIRRCKMEVPSWNAYK